MGHHYVPQEYLRHFAAKGASSAIWQFSKKDQSFGSQAIPIRSAAQSPDYYFQEDEKYLAANVEAPAQAPLNKLRNSEDLTPDERAHVSAYVQSMMKRGPWARRRAKATLAESFDSWRQKMISIAPDLERQYGWPVGEIIESLEKLWRLVHEVPISDKSELIKSQYSTGKIAMSIYCMNWVVVHAGPIGEFVTSDAPAFFTIGIGLENQEAELSIPLSTSVALHASWRGRPCGLEYIAAPTAQIFKELNRRTVREAVRFVYAPTPFGWIPKVSARNEDGWWAIRLRQRKFAPLKVSG
ncbi:MAG: DUF4238 domain-containing protein [Chloroflexota bacterium]|nr:DUF4238 domain-containing protein [Chloroflexota bacterium]